MHAFLPEVASEFQASQVSRQLDFQLWPFLRDLEEETFVLYDKSQLSQCLWKLLDTSREHSTPRSGLR